MPSVGFLIRETPFHVPDLCIVTIPSTPSRTSFDDQNNTHMLDNILQDESYGFDNLFLPLANRTNLLDYTPDSTGDQLSQINYPTGSNNTNHCFLLENEDLKLLSTGIGISPNLYKNSDELDKDYKPASLCDSPLKEEIHTSKHISNILSRYLQREVVLNNHIQPQMFCSLNQEQFKKYYILNHGGIERDDYCIRFYSNGIAILSLAKSNLALFKLLGYNFEDLKLNYLSKAFKSGICPSKSSVDVYLSDNTKIASIQSKSSLRDDFDPRITQPAHLQCVHTFRSCVKGRLIGYNSRLLDNINILFEEPEEEGWLIIILCSFSDLPENWIHEEDYKIFRRSELEKYNIQIEKTRSPIIHSPPRIDKLISVDTEKKNPLI